eukprot:412181-Heterocapsa_arctica.AAC.1
MARKAERDRLADAASGADVHVEPWIRHVRAKAGPRPHPPARPPTSDEVEAQHDHDIDVLLDTIADVGASSCSGRG